MAAIKKMQTAWKNFIFVIYGDIDLHQIRSHDFDFVTMPRN